MSLFNIFRPERSKRKVEELKQTLQLNPQYFKDLEMIKLKKQAKAFM
ncbi:MAG: hypothetical protein KGD58_00605 [Candidatus Lokiarchaeota archaeon]|nr:hypothetical protein [Candidatus Lokiarchaeota archaeon]